MMSPLLTVTKMNMCEYIEDKTDLIMLHIISDEDIDIKRPDEEYENEEYHDEDEEVKNKDEDGEYINEDNGQIKKMDVKFWKDMADIMTKLKMTLSPYIKNKIEECSIDIDNGSDTEDMNNKDKRYIEDETDKVDENSLNPLLTDTTLVMEIKGASLFPFPTMKTTFCLYKERISLLNTFSYFLHKQFVKSSPYFGVLKRHKK